MMGTSAMKTLRMELATLRDRRKAGGVRGTRIRPHAPQMVPRAPAKEQFMTAEPEVTLELCRVQHPPPPPKRKP